MQTCWKIQIHAQTELSSKKSTLIVKSGEVSLRKSRSPVNRIDQLLTSREKFLFKYNIISLSFSSVNS